MNSESFKFIQGIAKERQEQEKDKDTLATSEIVGKGQLAISFEEHKFWQIFKADMLGIRDMLMDKLTDSGSLTKAEMDTMRLEIRLIKRFANHPKQYIDSLKALSMRKGRQ